MLYPVRKKLVTLAGMASLLVGCKDSHSSPEQGHYLLLQVEQATYAYDPAEAGPRGSGDLGRSETKLRVGDFVLADCVIHHTNDTENLSDAVRVADGVFADQQVPMEIYIPTESNPQATANLVPVFDESADDIRRQLENC